MGISLLLAHDGFKNLCPGSDRSGTLQPKADLLCCLM